MQNKNNIIYFNDKKYIVINKTKYLENDYLFIINNKNLEDIKLLVCLDNYVEVNDIELIKEVLLNMNPNY